MPEVTPPPTGATGIVTVTVGSKPWTFSWREIWKSSKVLIYGVVSASLVALAHGISGTDFSALSLQIWSFTIPGTTLATVLVNVLLYAAGLLIRDTRDIQAA